MEVRKTVTVLFADVTGSTALGERLDPEATRGVMSRYFDETRAAAAQMREALAALNAELERDWGARIAVRTGVNTGEVVAGDPSTGQTFVTGDAVNVAARLEQAAEPGEILLGEETYRLVRDAVRVEPVERSS